MFQSEWNIGPISFRDDRMFGISQLYSFISIGEPINGPYFELESIGYVYSREKEEMFVFSKLHSLSLSQIQQDLHFTIKQMIVQLHIRLDGF